MSEPFLYGLVDTLYHKVMDSMPQALQDRDMASAFVLGSAGIYGVVRGLQWASKNFMDRIIPNFDAKWLPKLEKICAVGMAAAPILYSIFDQEGAKEIMAQHPTYTSGMVGVWAGSITAAVQDLHNRSKQNSLDEKLLKN